MICLARRRAPFLAASAAALLVANCTRDDDGLAVLTAEMPLHLEQRLDAATVVGARVPEDAIAPVKWRFGAAASEWRAVPFPSRGTLEMVAVDDALRPLAIS